MVSGSEIAARNRHRTPKLQCSTALPCCRKSLAISGVRNGHCNRKNHYDFGALRFRGWRSTPEIERAECPKTPVSEQLSCRSAEVKFFSVFCCQRCREIWREIWLKFSVQRFPGFGCARENFTKISRQKRCEKKENFTQISGIRPFCRQPFLSIFDFLRSFIVKKMPPKSAPEKVPFFSFLLPSQSSYFPSKLGKKLLL